MKGFFIKLLGFAFFLLGFALIIQLLISWRISHKVLTGLDTLDFMEGQDNQLVFIGSSRCYTGFDPALYETALGLHAANIAVEGHSELIMQMLRLENYLTKHPAPKFAILAFDPLVSSGSLDNNQNMVCKSQFARYALWPSAANQPIIRYFGFDPLERYLPLLALLKYEPMECLSLPADKAWRRWRYSRHDEHWDTLMFPVSISTKVITAAYKADTGLENGLRRFDALCSRNHIKLICVQTPIYQSAYIPEKFSDTRALCNDLHIPFFDLCTPQLDADVDNFFNIDHCNTTGVTKIAQTLLADTTFRNLFRDVRQ
jgi:hypothetical protein